MQVWSAARGFFLPVMTSLWNFRNKSIKNFNMPQYESVCVCVRACVDNLKNCKTRTHHFPIRYVRWYLQNLSSIFSRGSQHLVTYGVQQSSVAKLKAWRLLCTCLYAMFGNVWIYWTVAQAVLLRWFSTCQAPEGYLFLYYCIFSIVVSITLSSTRWSIETLLLIFMTSFLLRFMKETCSCKFGHLKVFSVSVCMCVFVRASMHVMQSLETAIVSALAEISRFYQISGETF